MGDSIKELTEKVTAFRDVRDWRQFHNPKDMAISISLEAAELLEIFQWSGSDTEADTEEKRAKIKEELADVMIYCFLLAEEQGFNVSEIIEDKLAQNNRKYPVQQAYGKADKYTAYWNCKNGGTGE